MASSKRDVHIVFLGPTGCGKSRLCNFLLKDDKAFTVKAGFQSVTEGIKMRWISIPNGDELVVLNFIDTQGLCDTKLRNLVVIDIIKEAIKQSITSVDYFVIMFRPGRMTDENRNALEDIIEAFQLDSEERKKNVFFILSHCECSSSALRLTYEKECLADRTIKRLLVCKDGRAQNFNCVGLPQPDEVNEWMYTGIIKWMDLQRESLLKYLVRPINGIRPVQTGIFENFCSIL